MGIGHYLQGQNCAVQLVGVQPDSPQNGIGGLKHLATDDVPSIYDPALVDQIAEVSTEDDRTGIGSTPRPRGKDLTKGRRGNQEHD